MHNYADRRKRLLSKVPDGSIIVLYSGTIQFSSPCVPFPFHVNRNFFYLTNIDQEETFLVLVKNKQNKEILYISDINIEKEKWLGKSLRTLEAKKISNIEDVRFCSSFIKDITHLLKSKSIKNIYIDTTHTSAYIDKLNMLAKSKKILDISYQISLLRLIKDNDEINDIKKAIEITNLGLNRVISELKTAKYEYELYNAFNHEVLNHGTHELGFSTIIANEKNACYLHYDKPFSLLKKNSLVLNDVGAGFHHYSSDISRTYPISGKFSEEQKIIYQIVLDCNKKIIEFIRPNLTLDDLQKETVRLLTKGCLEHKLIKKPEDIKKYYYHGVTHFLGLDNHDDICTKSAEEIRSIKLKPGMVMTVEPGLYFMSKGIGIRIEDDVLLTKNGPVNLSINIPKEINDIERLFIKE